MSNVTDIVNHCVCWEEWSGDITPICDEYTPDWSGNEQCQTCEHDYECHVNKEKEV